MAYLKADQEKESNKSEQILGIPRCVKLRKHAHDSQMRKTLGMLMRVTAVDVELKKVDIVHIDMAKV